MTDHDHRDVAAALIILAVWLLILTAYVLVKVPA